MKDVTRALESAVASTGTIAHDTKTATMIVIADFVVVGQLVNVVGGVSFDIRQINAE